MTDLSKMPDMTHGAQSAVSGDSYSSRIDLAKKCLILCGLLPSVSSLQGATFRLSYTLHPDCGLRTLVTPQ